MMWRPQYRFGVAEPAETRLIDDPGRVSLFFAGLPLLQRKSRGRYLCLSVSKLSAYLGYKLGCVSIGTQSGTRCKKMFRMGENGELLKKL